MFAGGGDDLMTLAAWPFEGLFPFKYGAILIDPPYSYAMRSEKGYEKSPEAHYDTLSEAELAAMPVGHLAAGSCMLFMWSTWPHLEQALRLMKAWGFTYKTGGSWTKRTPSGKPVFGTGYIFRSSTEPFLVGTIGEPQIKSRSVRNLIDSARREHSRKPPEMRAMVDQLMPHVFACELFAREPWPGRDVWGKETRKFADLAKNAELAGRLGRGLAEGGAVSGAPAGLFGGEAVVDREGGNGQLLLLGEQLLADSAQRVAVDGQATELRGEGERAERLDDRVTVGRGRAIDGGETEYGGKNPAHARTLSSGGAG